MLFNLMDEFAEVMHRDTRTNIVKVLILMRNKGLIEVIPLLKSLFNYFRINDKQLRALIYSHIITDISSANKGKINENVRFWNVDDDFVDESSVEVLHVRFAGLRF